MFYAIEYAYGRGVINNGVRADRVLQFTRRELRDMWVKDNEQRDNLIARDPRVRKADWLEDGDPDGWGVIARNRVLHIASLKPYAGELLTYAQPRWVATASEQELIQWAVAIN